MTKLELAIRSTEWKIEAAEKTIEEMRNSIKGSIDSQHLEYDVEFILSYAQRMQEAAKELQGLREQKQMLTYLASEE